MDVSNCNMAALVIHGGLNSKESFEKHYEAYKLSMQRIIAGGYWYLKGHGALETAIYTCKLLEDDPILNAGTGSVIQADGVIRMSASLMDGRSRIFSGVMNIEKVKNPVEVAARLQSEKDRVLAGQQANLYARNIGIPEFDTETPERRREFEEKKSKKVKPTSTGGCVVLDEKGNIAASTSTGGKGWEIPGRVGDSPTTAGNYANALCGVSCTGTGEDIISAAVASSFVTRISDGMDMAKAKARALEELNSIKGSAGFIALNKKAEIITGATEPYLVWAKADEKGTEIFT